MPAHRSIAGLLSSAATGVGARIWTQATALVAMLVAARVLGPEDFGIYAIATIFSGFVRMLLYTGAFEFLLKARAPRRVSAACLTVNTALAALLSVASLLVFAAFDWGAAEDRIALLIILLVPSNFAAALVAWLEVHLLRGARLGYYYGTMILADGLALSVALIMLHAGFGLFSLVAQLYVRMLVSGVAYAGAGVRGLAGPTSWRRIVDVVAWAAPRYVEATLVYVSNYFADFVLGLHLSLTTAGLYRGANRITQAVSDVVGQPVKVIAQTHLFGRVAAGAAAEGEIRKLLLLTGFAVSTTLPLLSALSEPVVALVLGEAWLGAAPLVSLLCAARGLVVVDGIFSTALVAVDRQRLAASVGTASTLALIAVVVVVVPFGLMALVVSIVAVRLATSLTYLAIAVRTFPGARLVSPLVRAAVLATAVFLAARFGHDLAAARAIAAIPALLAGAASGLAVAGLALAVSFPALRRAL